MAYDGHANLVLSAVATAPAPALSGTSLVIAAGDGAKLPTPPFNMTVWPVNTTPTQANSEILRVTNVATDTLTIARATATEPVAIGPRTILVGDQIALAVTAKTIKDIELAGTTNAVIIGTGAGAAPIADANWLIEQTGHTLASATQPRATVTNSAAQSINSAAETAVSFDTNIDAIPATIHSTSSNQTRFVIPAAAAGFYQLCASIVFAPNATGRRYVYFRKNGTTGIAGVVAVAVNSATPPTTVVNTCQVTLAAADYIEIMAYQDSGGALNIGSNIGLGSGGQVWASIVKVW